MKPGIKSTEFWMVAGVVAASLLMSRGKVSMNDIATAKAVIRDAPDLVTMFINTIRDIIDRFGDLGISAGLAWAYLERRTKLKTGEASTLVDKPQGASDHAV